MLLECCTVKYKNSNIALWKLYRTDNYVFLVATALFQCLESYWCGLRKSPKFVHARNASGQSRNRQTLAHRRVATAAWASP
jgi:hypothetical protein